MSPAEYIELIRMHGDSISGNAMNFMSIVFAYLVAVYLVAKKLKVLEMVALTILYSFAISFPARSSFLSYEIALRLREAFANDHPESFALFYGEQTALGSSSFLLAGFFMLSWLTSVIYMVTERLQSKVGT